VAEYGSNGQGLDRVEIGSGRIESNWQGVENGSYRQGWVIGEIDIDGW
jgi:hypothetical protein